MMLRLLCVTLCVVLVSINGEETAEAKHERLNKAEELLVKQAEKIRLEAERAARDMYDKLEFDEEGLDEEDVEGTEEDQDEYETEDLEGAFHMDDFAPSHVFTFPLDGRIECFFEDITKAPMKIRGAYFVSGDGGLEIGVRVSKVEGSRDRDQEKQLFTDNGKTEGTFAVVASSAGQYKFCFVDSSRSAKQVTFALHVGVRKRESAKPEHITPLEDSIKRCHHTLQELVAEQNFIVNRVNRHMSTQDSTEWRVAWYTVFESFFMLVVTMGQVFYVQRLINNRQWV